MPETDDSEAIVGTGGSVALSNPLQYNNPTVDGAEGGLSMLDDLTLPFEGWGAEVDGFFTMPPVFPYDLSVFFNNDGGSLGKEG